MNPLQLPELLKGGWQHALILTYGLDALFFENALMPVLGNSCRNRIILADGQRFLGACANYADSNLVRFLNQRYLAEGIHTPNAAHAKLILLTHPARGRLLVGSGNLNLQGYASDGELFTQYDWTPEEPDALPAFQAARELIAYLIDAGLLSATARFHYDHLLENSLWLNQRAAAEWQPVRHNVQMPLLQQFQEALGGEGVEELWIMSPFYDPDARALAAMLERLKPQKVKLLLQQGRTSADPQALRSVLDHASSRSEILTIRHASGDSPYFHAKLYLAKLPQRAVCLQGSPNLSQVAMLRTVRNGNIELANLLQGPRDGFDHLFQPLILEPAALDDPALDIRYRSDDEEEPAEAGLPFRLLGGRWAEEQLTLAFDRNFPALEGARLNLDDRLFPLNLISRSGREIKVQLSETALALLSRTTPVFLQWDHFDPPVRSNPIFAFNLASLRHELAEPVTRARPDDFGSLDIADEDIEELIDDLQAHMVLDRESIWQLANRPAPAASAATGDDSQRIAYDEVDYEMLRQHPKIRQYTHRDGGSGFHTRSRLQIILSSITDHFNGLVDSIYGNSPQDSTVPLKLVEEEMDADSEEDVQEELETRQIRRHSLDRRLRNIFKHFIRRYLRGLASDDFQEIAGYEVVSHNVIIFSNLLWRLTQKEYFADDPDFLVDAMVKTWQLFWGSSQGRGYFAALDEAKQEEVLQWLREYYGAGLVLASLFWSEKVTRADVSLRLQVRDCWHHLLISRPFPIGKEAIEEAWILVAETARHQPPRPTFILQHLERLANFRIDKEFLDWLRSRYGPNPGHFTRATVYSDRLHGETFVKCLVLRAPNALADQNEAVSLLLEWMRFEQLENYRIVTPEVNRAERLILYGRDFDGDCYFDRAVGVIEDIEELTVPEQPWDRQLRDIVHIAESVNQEMAFAAKVVLDATVNTASRAEA